MQRPAYATCVFLGAGLLLVFALARIMAVSVGRQPQPHIAVEKTIADFGRIPTSQPARYRFMVTNAGDAELFILETKADCECTSVALSRKALPPGESMPLGVTFMPKKAGQRQQRVLVTTNDRQYPVTVLTLRATVFDATTRECPR